MKPKDQGGVVGPNLDVYGVTGLKVAGKRRYRSHHALALLSDDCPLIDLSICPTNVGNVRTRLHCKWSNLGLLTDLFSLIFQNTYSTALLIGEKAAVIIAQDLNLNLH